MIVNIKNNKSEKSTEIHKTTRTRGHMSDSKTEIK
jgi:hypothetical protein